MSAIHRLDLTHWEMRRRSGCRCRNSYEQRGCRIKPSERESATSAKARHSIPQLHQQASKSVCPDKVPTQRQARTGRTSGARRDHGYSILNYLIYYQAYIVHPTECAGAMRRVGTCRVWARKLGDPRSTPHCHPIMPSGASGTSLGACGASMTGTSSAERSAKHSRPRSVDRA
jgi:hypothetical protein